MFQFCNLPCTSARLACSCTVAWSCTLRSTWRAWNTIFAMCSHAGVGSSVVDISSRKKKKFENLKFYSSVRLLFAIRNAAQ